MKHFGLNTIKTASLIEKISKPVLSTSYNQINTPKQITGSLIENTSSAIVSNKQKIANQQKNSLKYPGYKRSASPFLIGSSGNVKGKNEMKLQKLVSPNNKNRRKSSDKTADFISNEKKMMNATQPINSQNIIIPVEIIEKNSPKPIPTLQKRSQIFKKLQKAYRRWKMLMIISKKPYIKINIPPNPFSVPISPLINSMNNAQNQSCQKNQLKPEKKQNLQKPISKPKTTQYSSNKNTHSSLRKPNLSDQSTQTNSIPLIEILVFLQCRIKKVK